MKPKLNPLIPFNPLANDMTLRDYFAGQAIAGLMSANTLRIRDSEQATYLAADMMLGDHTKDISLIISEQMALHEALNSKLWAMTKRRRQAVEGEILRKEIDQVAESIESLESALKKVEIAAKGV